MRKITANYIFPVSSPPIKNGIVVLNDQNQIVDVIDRKGDTKEIQDLEFYSGMIVPGFVDAFTLLSWPSFTFDSGISEFKQLENRLAGSASESASIQRGINHLEAFGTKGAVDFFPHYEGEEKKLKSKVFFKNCSDLSDCNYEFPTEVTDGNNLILINNLTAKSLDQKLSDRYCVGTGSLAMHQKLSVWEQLKWLQKQFPDQSIWDLIQWGSLNPAKLLAFEELGSIEVGKTPGVNLLTKLDFQNWKLKDDSELTVLI